MSNTSLGIAPRKADKLATTASPPLARLVADLSPLPAMLMNHRYDILAWNGEMVTPCRRRSAIRCGCA